MLQEDSNGETSFEIIHKKSEESPTPSNGDKTESISSIVSPYSIPSPTAVNVPDGNLLSNVPPPAAIPDFTLWQSQSVPAPSPLPQNLLNTSSSQTQSVSIETKTLPSNTSPVFDAASAQPISQRYLPTQFSAAIPPSKGIQHGPTALQSASDSSQNSGGLINWMKDAVASGGILSKVAEKAKHSVDSLITTLDPQMSEFIYSGGDIEMVVAVHDLDDVVPVREAIYSVFGKAWVNGVILDIDNSESETIGFEEGIKTAEHRINVALQLHKSPTIVIENLLLHQNDNWFDLSVLLLKDPAKQVTLQTFTQTTPIPVDEFLKQAAKEMREYAETCDSTEKLLATYLQSCKNNWQQRVTGVSRKETLYLAAKVLASVYKNKLINL